MGVEVTGDEIVEEIRSEMSELDIHVEQNVDEIQPVKKKRFFQAILAIVVTFQPIQPFSHYYHYIHWHKQSVSPSVAGKAVNWQQC